MCEYCDCKFDNGISIKGKLIAEGAYEECYLKKDNYNGEFRIEVLGDSRGQSFTVAFCPFCGRKLNDIQAINEKIKQDKLHGY